MRAAALAVALTLFAVATARAQPAGAVRAWTGELRLPTTVEGPANPNPPFDPFAVAGRFNYPYALRDALTDQQRVVRYRALFLENEFLKISVLPELGGHLYSCLDKISGHEMFYANPSIKKALIGYRGAWAAFGIEFNFPVSHNWMSLSPVDSAVVSNADGSASIWVGNVDRVFGSEWRVELRLAPGRAVVEQHTTLFNRSDARHRFYWWTNAAVQVQDDSQLIYPTHLMATHGFTAIDPWPVDAHGRDLSVIRNQTDGPVSLFTYGTREPFMAVWHPASRSGTVHVAAVSELPFDKFWSWGVDREALGWRETLSDDHSAYIELQAGLFRNQETYAFLEPQEVVRFSEYWLPARDLGGITRATVDAVLHADVRDERLAIELNVTHALPNARIRVCQGDRRFEVVASLSPRRTWRGEWRAPGGAGPWTVDLLNARGIVLLSHSSEGYDALTPSDAPPGPQARRPVPGAKARSEGDFVEIGRNQELNGRRLEALSTYREGLRAFAGSLALTKSAGRLATALHWADPAAGADEGTSAAEPMATGWLRAAYARDVTDMETRYYLGVAEAAGGRDREAAAQFEAAQRFTATRTASLLQLARLAARHGDQSRALEWLAMLTAAAPANALAGALEVACLRRAQQPDEARRRLTHWRRIDPVSTMLRYEAQRLGASAPGLWSHLSVDSARVFDLVDQYLALGALDEALDLLSRAYPRVPEPASEIGTVSPPDDPLVAYYRGYVRQRLGQSGDADFRRASALPVTYVFPHRATSYAVLRAALQANPSDGHALFLLGSLHFADGLVDQAIADWTEAQRLAPDTPTLHRNLGLALFKAGRVEAAIDVLKQGARYDARNVDLYLALDGALSAARAPVRDRVAALEQYPSQVDLPSALVFRLAFARAEGGENVESLFRGRYFAAEEGGTNPERVLVAARSLSARALADAGRCDAALAIVDGVTHADAAMPFSGEALEAAASDPWMQLQLARVEAACGRRDAAQRRWAPLARDRPEATPATTAIVYEAASSLQTAGGVPSPARLEAALAEITAVIDSGDSSAPGTALYVQARLRAALGRLDQARNSLARVFLLPDRNLSHALARRLEADLMEHSK
jgi:tetratricopeptide (TPR) repeat protein